MNIKNQKLMTLLSLMAISGEFPYDQIQRIIPGSYTPKLLTSLRSDEMISSWRCDGMYSYRIQPKTKTVLVGQFPERFRLYFTGATHANNKNKDPKRVWRLHRMAESLCTMYLAGFQVFPDLQPPIFAQHWDDSEEIHLEPPIYFDSRQVKEIGSEVIRIKGSRFAGVLLSQRRVDVVYNAGNSVIGWSTNSEIKTKATLRYILCQQRLSELYRPEQIHGIMLGANMEIGKQLLCSNGGLRRTLFRVDDTFESFPFVPHSTEGITMLQILLNPHLKAALNEILMQNITISMSSNLVCDGQDEQGLPVLLAWDFDLVRIHRFLEGLRFLRQKGSIICFDFQEQAFHPFQSMLIKIQTISLDKLRKEFFSDS